MAAEQEDKYKAEKLGQLTAVSMLMIRRGPECLHLTVVRESFKQAQPHEIESIDDGQVMHDLLNIRNWNYDCLLDLSIIPGRKSKEELFRLYMLTTLIHANMGAIAQFKDGIDMVS